MKTKRIGLVAIVLSFLILLTIVNRLSEQLEDKTAEAANWEMLYNLSD